MNILDRAASQPATRRFQLHAEAYSDWVRNGTDNEIEAIQEALTHLLALCHTATLLPSNEKIETIASDPGPWPSTESIDSLRKRLALRLPFSYYHEALEPLEIYAGTSIGMGDLHDDLLDTLVDLEGGLRIAATAGLNAAAVHWAWSFAAHWGAHATSAIPILKKVIANPRILDNQRLPKQ